MLQTFPDLSYFCGLLNNSPLSYRLSFCQGKADAPLLAIYNELLTSSQCKEACNEIILGDQIIFMILISSEYVIQLKLSR